MSNYANLISSVQAVIAANGNNEITGPILQQTLIAIINSLGVGYQYVGIATPTTNPGTPDQKVFYIACAPGTYSNFGGVVIFPGTIGLLIWDGSWSKKEFRPLYVNNSSMQNAIQELYINGYDSSLRLSILTWNGTKLSLRIISSGSIVSVITNKTVSPYEPVYFESSADSPIALSGIIVMNENTVSASSSSGYQIYSGTENLLLKPISTRKLFDVYKETIQSEDAPLCVRRFNRGALNPNGLYNNSYISISRHFNQTHDSVFVFGNKDAAAVTNKFWDFMGAYIHARTDTGIVYSPPDVTQFGSSIVLATTTDCICPVVVGAVANIDGDNNSKWFTGQNHAYGNISNGVSRTMREISCSCNVDGIDVPIGSGSIRGKMCTIEVVNQIQGYNTCKENGSGREIIKQKITVVITQNKCSVRVEYIALEDVVFYNIPGIGQYGAPNTGRQFRFIGSTSKMGLYEYNGVAVSPNASDNKINCLQFLRDGKAINLTVKNFGLGNLVYNPSQNNAYASTANKVYTRLTGDNVEIPLSANDKIGFEFEYEIVNDAF